MMIEFLLYLFISISYCFPILQELVPFYASTSSAQSAVDGLRVESLGKPFICVQSNYNVRLFVF